jgi:ribosome-binding protein aMBF1 (putative translation factor)
MPRTKNFAKVIQSKLATDRDLAEAVSRERFNAKIACEILAMRTKAGLTQKQLADKIGTRQSVIARLEDADYDSHSLKMLQRIADGLGKRLAIRFVNQAGDAPPERGASASRR